VLIQPVQGLAVFLSDFRGDPDDRCRIVAGSIGEQLPEVIAYFGPW